MYSCNQPSQRCRRPLWPSPISCAPPVPLAPGPQLMQRRRSGRRGIVSAWSPRWQRIVASAFIRRLALTPTEFVGALIGRHSDSSFCTIYRTVRYLHQRGSLRELLHRILRNANRSLSENYCFPSTLEIFCRRATLWRYSNDSWGRS